MEEEEFDRWRDTQTFITVPVLREFMVMETIWLNTILHVRMW